MHLLTFIARLNGRSMLRHDLEESTTTPENSTSQKVPVIPISISLVTETSVAVRIQLRRDNNTNRFAHPAAGSGIYLAGFFLLSF